MSESKIAGNDGSVTQNGTWRILSEKKDYFCQPNGKRHSNTAISSDSSLTPPESGVISLTKKLDQIHGLSSSSQVEQVQQTAV